MKKVVLMSTIALLALSIMIISPVKAITKEPYWAHHEMTQVDPGKVWISEEGILQTEDSYWVGTNVGSLGVGTLEIWFEHMSLDPATGKGNSRSKILVTIPDKGTIEGVAGGTIEGFWYASGKFVGTRGTGDFAYLNAMGTYSAVFTSPTTALIDCVGTSIYP